MTSKESQGQKHLPAAAISRKKLPLGKMAERLEAAQALLEEKSDKPNESPPKTEEREAHEDASLNFMALFQEALISKMPRGIIAVDLDGNITIYNKAAQVLLKVPREEVLFQPFWKHFDDGCLGFSLRQILKAKQSPGTAYIIEESPEGNNRHLESEATFFNYSEESEITETQKDSSLPDGMIILLQDVTDKKHSDFITQQRQQMNELGELAAALAHEIRNPLGGIKGFASLLERDLSDRPDLKKMASFIIEGTTTLNNLVTKVLNYASPITILFESVDLVPMVKQLRNEILSSPTYAKNVRFEIKTSHETIIASIDPHSIRKCLHNLIINAIEAMTGSGGIVIISLEKDNTSVQILIEDTGIGINKEIQQKIFSPFFTTKPDASGFGLSEAYKIIQLHGGRINVKSHEGKGTTFTIKLPIERKNEAKI